MGRAPRSSRPGGVAVVVAMGLFFGWQNVNWHEPQRTRFKQRSAKQINRGPLASVTGLASAEAWTTCCPMFQLSSLPRIPSPLHSRKKKKR